MQHKDEAEMRMPYVAIRTTQANAVDFDRTLAEWKAAVEAKRAEEARL